MGRRVILAKFLIRLGAFIQSLAVMVMREDDLIEFSRRSYQRDTSFWSDRDWVDKGLTEAETALLEKVPLQTGRLLLLGVGGGRDAIPLARRGYEITGVDFVPEMVQKARENASRQGVTIDGLVQEISDLEVPPGSYDFAWLASAGYSSFPTRRRRVRVLRRVKRALKLGGYFYCSFWWAPTETRNPKAELVRKVFAFLTGGNREYEPGDMLALNSDFLHVFTSQAELQSEFAEGGFTLLEIVFPASDREGAALLVSRDE